MSPGMPSLAPYPVALPLLAAACLAILPRRVPRGVAEAAALAVALGTAWIGGVLARGAEGFPSAYWFGGWKPHAGMAPGIGFVADGIAGGLVCFAASLVAIAILFGWSYLKAPARAYHSLLLIFLAGANGFALSGDLFTLFVCLELMGVAAYVLASIHLERSSLQGAFHFAVTNSAGAMLLLWGIALLYGRFGALNMAQLSAAVAGHAREPLVGAAWALIAAGLLVKAAIVPFHFWLPDVHAVAPAPVSLLFSGIMVELGLYGLARVDAVVFAAAGEGRQGAIRVLFLGLGSLTILAGGGMCLMERHMKRLLAFSTVSHAGIILLGIAEADAQGLAGASLYVIGHGACKGALFLCMGVLHARFGTQDLMELRGCGRKTPLLGILFVAAALGLMGMPPFASFAGKAWIEASAGLPAGFALMPLAGSLLTGMAVLRAAGRIFLGAGKGAHADTEASGATRTEDGAIRPGAKGWGAWVRVPIVLLLAMGLAAGLWPGMRSGAWTAARSFADRPVYATHLGLEAEGASIAPRPPPPEAGSGKSQLLSLGVAAVAAGWAAWSLRTAGRERRGWGMFRLGLIGMRAIQSGNVRDYLAWMVAGLGVLAAVLAR
jgi:multicomponent Na+:H+ antiporter subunit D